jgi:hypothetical protein
MRRFFRAATSFPLALVSVTAAAQELPPAERYHLRGEYWRWSVNLESQFQKGFGTEPGTLIDGKDVLGLTGGNSNVVRGVIRFGQSAKLRGSWIQMDYRADQISPETFSFGNEVFFKGDRVLTAVKGNLYTGDFEYDFVRKPQGYLGLYLGAVLLDADSLLVAPDEGKQVAQTGRFPVPIIGMNGRTYYGKHLSFEGELGWGTIGDKGHVSVLGFTGRIHLSDRLAFVGGYHRIHMHGHDERDSVDVTMGGWLFGGELSL